MSAKLLLLVHVLVTWYLVGLIWTIQVVHYNLFDRVGADAFVKYEADHTQLITPIVAPPMLLELATAAWLLFAPPAGVPRWALIAGFLCVIGIWLSTFFIQVPLHERLMGGFDQADYDRLVRSNWIRTVLWTARGLLVGFCAHQLMK